MLTLVTLTVVHATTGERKALRLKGVYKREIALLWPMYGEMRFHNRTGEGIAKHKAWRIEAESLASIHKELEIGPDADGEGGQRDIKETR